MTQKNLQEATQNLVRAVFISLNHLAKRLKTGELMGIAQD